ncbi:transcription factor SPT20 [Biomphalaria glabrata]|nr:transcription factor SPT20 [Biomphalaria glabrata]
MISNVNMFAVMRVKWLSFPYDVFFNSSMFQRVLECLKSKKTELCEIQTSKQDGHYEVTSTNRTISRIRNVDLRNISFECTWDTSFNIFSKIDLLGCSRMNKPVEIPKDKCDLPFFFIMKWQTNEYFDDVSLYNCSLGSELFAYSTKRLTTTTTTTTRSNVTLTYIPSEGDLTDSTLTYNNDTTSNYQTSVSILETKTNDQRPESITFQPPEPFKTLRISEEQSESITTIANSFHNANVFIMNNENTSMTSSNQLNVTNTTLIIIGFVVGLSLIVSLVIVCLRLRKRKHTNSECKDQPLVQYRDNSEHNDSTVVNVFSFRSTSPEDQSKPFPAVEELLHDDYLSLDERSSEVALSRTSQQTNATLVQTRSENSKLTEDTVAPQHHVQDVYSKLNENIKLMTNVYGDLLPERNDASLLNHAYVLETESSEEKQGQSLVHYLDTLEQNDRAVENAYTFYSTHSEGHSKSSPAVEDLLQDNYVPIDTPNSEVALPTCCQQTNVSLQETQSENGETTEETVTPHRHLQDVYSKLNENIKLMTNVYDDLLPACNSKDKYLQSNVKAKNPTDITINQSCPDTDTVYSNQNITQFGNYYEDVSGSDSTITPHDKILTLLKCDSMCNTVTGVDADQDTTDGTIYFNEHANPYSNHVDHQSEPSNNCNNEKLEPIFGSDVQE